jgi:hypothetical protein
VTDIPFIGIVFREASDLSGSHVKRNRYAPRSIPISGSKQRSKRESFVSVPELKVRPPALIAASASRALWNSIVVSSGLLLRQYALIHNAGIFVRTILALGARERLR